MGSVRLFLHGRIPFRSSALTAGALGQSFGVLSSFFTILQLRNLGAWILDKCVTNTPAPLGKHKWFNSLPMERSYYFSLATYCNNGFLILPIICNILSNTKAVPTDINYTLSYVHLICLDCENKRMQLVLNYIPKDGNFRYKLVYAMHNQIYLHILHLRT